jgi:hypothetical protein
MQRQDLQKLSREELIREAERAGVARPRVLTHAELIDEILKRTAASDKDRSRSRGWLGRARDLLATVIEKGLHLPDAAAAIRGGSREWPPAPPAPLPTVTLAEIYAAQGHLERAVAVLDEVLEREPEHQEARELRERFLAQLGRGAAAEAPKAAKDASKEAEEAPKEAEETLKEAAEAPEAARPTSALAEAPQPEASPKKEDEGAAPPTIVTPRSGSPLGAAAPSGHEGAASPAAAAPEQEGAAKVTAVEVVSGEQVTMAPPLVIEERPALEVDVAPVISVAQVTTRSPNVTLAEAAPSLHERHDVDEVVALAVDPGTFYVYWEVRPTTFARLVSKSPGGTLALRVVAVTPGWDGPIVESRDIPIDALFGDRFIHHVRPRADVRVSIGWLLGDRFDPIAVGAEISAPRAFVAAGTSAPDGAPLDLSEGPHGMHASFVSAAFPHEVRGAPAERESGKPVAGRIPRQLFGATIEARSGQRTLGPARWVWVPRPRGAEAGASPEAGVHMRFGPAAAGFFGPSETHEPRWSGASEEASWGGASEGASWGGASDVTSWGGAS